jgi:hypothetical protein
MAMSEGPRQPIHNTPKRFIAHCFAFVAFGRYKTPPSNVLIAAATPPDDTEAANAELPPEPAWVELSAPPGFDEPGDRGSALSRMPL